MTQGNQPRTQDITISKFRPTAGFFLKKNIPVKNLFYLTLLNNENATYLLPNTYKGAILLLVKPLQLLFLIIVNYKLSIVNR